MEYKRIIKDDLTYHLINTDRFKLINIVIFFTKVFDKKSIPYSVLLSNNMVYSSKKYNTKSKIASHSEDLFGSKITSAYSIIGACESLSFSLEFVNPKYTDNEYLTESIDFLKEVILNPNIEENGFNKVFFDIIKKEAISNINAVKDNPSTYASIKYASLMYNGTPSAYSTISTVEEINEIDNKKLYNFYKKLFDGTYKIDICILGEVEDNIIDIIHNSFKNIKSNNKKITFTVKHKYDDKLINRVDSVSYNQSKLYIGYRLIDLNYHELNHVLKVYNTILGTMNDSILFNVVREANSLCYSIGSYVSRFNPSLTIYAGINKNNYEKSIELIKKCVNMMNDKKEVSRLFDSAKKTINTYLNNYYDDMIAQINNYYTNEFEAFEDIETLRKNINNVTIDEVISLNKKIKLSTIYMLKGENESD